jgi:hypothetical protein
VVSNVSGALLGASQHPRQLAARIFFDVGYINTIGPIGPFCLGHSLMPIPNMGKPEASVEDHLVQGVAERGGWAAKMVDKGRRGAPDRECRFPRPQTIYVETKAADGILKPWQREYHNDLRRLGYIVLVLWTIPQVNKFLLDYDRGMYG